MFFLSLGLSLSLTNLTSPLSCVGELFCRRDRDQENGRKCKNPKNNIPRTSGEMHDFIANFKKSEDKAAASRPMKQNPEYEDGYDEMYECDHRSPDGDYDDGYFGDTDSPTCSLSE